MLQFGIDHLLQLNPAWKQSRIGMITNEAARTRDGIASRRALLENGFHINMLFSPEHGLDVKGADGHAMSDGTDILTSLPVISLYGERLAPEASHLNDIDILLFDVPDVGACDGSRCKVSKNIDHIRSSQSYFGNIGIGGRSVFK
jgi:uncharacterized protein YbbC (DUF1343 family)